MNIETRLKRLETCADVRRYAPILAHEIKPGRWQVRPSWATGLPDDAVVSAAWLEAWPGVVIDVTVRADEPHLETVRETMARLGENWIELSRAERERGIVAFTGPDGATHFKTKHDLEEREFQWIKLF